MRDRAFVEELITLLNELASTNVVKNAIEAEKRSQQSAPAPSDPLESALERFQRMIEEKVAGLSEDERRKLAERAVQSQSDACGKAFFAERYAECEAIARQLLLSCPSHFLFQLMLISTQRMGQSNVPWPMIASLLSQSVKDVWYRDLLKLTLGQADPAKVLANAKDDDQRCEALFYTAMRLKTLGQNQAYVATLNRCAAMQSTTAENRLAKMRP
jgi:phosphopantetheinyl transferase (holo-ACP synthase)